MECVVAAHGCPVDPLVEGEKPNRYPQRRLFWAEWEPQLCVVHMDWRSFFFVRGEKEIMQKNSHIIAGPIVMKLENLLILAGW